MIERKLLELAAKAVGLRLVAWDGIFGEMFAIDDDNGDTWMPHFNDGDALRLAVKLGIFTATERLQSFHAFYRDEIRRDSPPTTAARRAIVRAAAEIGRAMP